MATSLRIVFLAGCDYGHTWQPTQEIFSRVLSAGHRVLYIEPTGTRNLGWRDYGRLMTRLQHAFLTYPEAPITPSGTIYAPLVLPFPFSGVARVFNRWLILRAIRRWLSPARKADVLWVWFPSSLNADLAVLLWPVVTVYHVMSSIEGASLHPQLVEAHRKLMGEADLVFANSATLFKALSPENPRTHLFRAGVHVEQFRQASPRPRDLPPRDRTIIGYCGAVHRWVDLTLLGKLAEAMPKTKFVMVGPVLVDISALRQHRNLLWLGQKPHQDVPAYLREFDVAIIPYVQDAYTATSFPAKVHEYLMMGKPVVAMTSPELEAYNQEFHVLRLATDADSFVKEIQDALHESPLKAKWYAEVALRHDWPLQMANMMGLIQRQRELKGYAP